MFINLGLTGNKDDYELCMRAENVELPAEGYHGVSAATGGLAGLFYIYFIILYILIEK